MIAVNHVSLALALVALVALTGCADGGLGGGFPDETYAPGEAVGLKQENTTIAVAVEDYRLTGAYDADDGAGGTRTVTAPDGEQFLFVKVTVENVGSVDGATPAVAVRPKNASSAGEGPTPTWMTDDWYRSVRPLPAGETRTGWVRATVAGNVTAADARVAFSTDVLVTSGEYRWLLVQDDEE
ncbi:hypothetical protein [Haloarchaeobius sp. HRN-SO-5]|uniref:hypothetical protein n=1 Tax=Haloarchaeobius sp. HRN-SO-5 TaxID=3446118 RepID=UPI003EB9AA39